MKKPVLGFGMTTAINSASQNLLAGPFRGDGPERTGNHEHGHGGMDETPSSEARKNKIPRPWAWYFISLLMATANVALLIPAASAEKAAATEKSDEKKTVKYVGNSESKKYHKPSCDYAKKISKANLVKFTSVAEAKKAGYVPCKICLPGEQASAAATESAAGKAKPETKTLKSGQ